MQQHPPAWPTPHFGPWYPAGGCGGCGAGCGYGYGYGCGYGCGGSCGGCGGCGWGGPGVACAGAQHVLLVPVACAPPPAQSPVCMAPAGVLPEEEKQRGAQVTCHQHADQLEKELLRTEDEHASELRQLQAQLDRLRRVLQEHCVPLTEVDEEMRRMSAKDMPVPKSPQTSSARTRADSLNTLASAGSSSDASFQRSPVSLTERIGFLEASAGRRLDGWARRALKRMTEQSAEDILEEAGRIVAAQRGGCRNPSALVQSLCTRRRHR